MPDWRLYYHVVWGTKNSLACIDPVWENNLHDFIWGRALTLDCIPYAIGGMPDHLHVVLSIPPKLSVASLIVQLKSSSCHYANANYTDGSLLWQAEYGIMGFSKSSLATIVDYVRGQKERHALYMLIGAMENLAT